MDILFDQLYNDIMENCQPGNSGYSNIGFRVSVLEVKSSFKVFFISWTKVEKIQFGSWFVSVAWQICQWMSVIVYADVVCNTSKGLQVSM